MGQSRRCMLCAFIGSDCLNNPVFGRLTLAHKLHSSKVMKFTKTSMFTAAQYCIACTDVWRIGVVLVISGLLVSCTSESSQERDTTIAKSAAANAGPADYRPPMTVATGIVTAVRPQFSALPDNIIALMEQSRLAVKPTPADPVPVIESGKDIVPSMTAKEPFSGSLGMKSQKSDESNDFDKPNHSMPPLPDNDRFVSEGVVTQLEGEKTRTEAELKKLLTSQQVKEVMRYEAAQGWTDAQIVAFRKELIHRLTK